MDVSWMHSEHTGWCRETVNDSIVQRKILWKETEGKRSFLFFGKDDLRMESHLYVFFMNILKDPEKLKR